MAALGLSPPYTLRDIQQAYLAKVKRAHPDTGGSTAAFLDLQKAYQLAKQYVLRHPFRLSWLADDVEFYCRQRAWIAQLSDCGATVALEQSGGLAYSWGEDFVHLADRVVRIHMHGPQITDDAVGILLHDRRMLAYLRVLDLRASKVTDHGLGKLPALASLQSLILCDTAVTGRGLVETVDRLPELRVVDLRNTSLRRTTLMRLRWSLPDLQVLAGHLLRHLVLPTRAT